MKRRENKGLKLLRKTLSTGLALSLSLTLGAALAPITGTIPQGPSAGLVQTAHADEASDLEAKVKESAATYNSAVAKKEQLANEIEELKGKIAKLEKMLPKQQKRSDESYRALYKYQYDSSSVVMMLLSSKSITDMLAALDQYNWVIEYNTDEIAKTVAMEKEYEAAKKKVESDKADADAAANEAYTSLQEAKQAREEARQRAIAAQKAEAEAKRKAAEEAAAQASTPAEKKAAKKEVTEAKAEEKDASSSTSKSSAGGVDWSSDKTAFVNKWAPRIDSYLSGSPTAGTGKYYAAAAWDNGVDPRWAPAISLVESSKGAACFASYNAWGYGGRGFSSWEDGINTVVASLGGPLYGGYLTLAAAKTYCPPTYQDWYSKVKSQMAQI